MVYIVGYLVFTTAVVGYASAGTTYPSVCRHTLVLYHKKSVLSQRWPRNAPYTWVPWKFRDSLTTPTATIPNIISRDFVRIDPMNVPTKFEVRCFIRSWDNWGTKKIWAVAGYAHAPFSQKFLIGFYSDWPSKRTSQIWSP